MMGCLKRACEEESSNDSAMGCSDGPVLRGQRLSLSSGARLILVVDQVLVLDARSLGADGKDEFGDVVTKQLARSGRQPGDLPWQGKSGSLKVSSMQLLVSVRVSVLACASA